MKVFVTGATGFVGSAVVQELIGAGHQVIGLARSEAAAQSLTAAGAEVHKGDLEDLESLMAGAAMADGIIHTGFIHDFSRFKEMCEVDRKAIETMGAAIAGTNKPFVVTSAIGLMTPGKLAVETDMPIDGPNPRIASERAVDALAASGVHVAIVRLPPTVHDAGDHGFVPILINIAREKGISVYKQEGNNQWSAVHRLDAAKLYRLALEQPSAPGTRFHAIGEEGVAFREIAEVIGKQLNVPVQSMSAEDAAAHFTWFAHFAGFDCPASSKHTQQTLGWAPQQKGIIADMNENYFTA